MDRSKVKGLRFKVIGKITTFIFSVYFSIIRVDPRDHFVSFFRVFRVFCGYKREGKGKQLRIFDFDQDYINNNH